MVVHVNFNFRKNICICDGTFGTTFLSSERVAHNFRQEFHTPYLNEMGKKFLASRRWHELNTMIASSRAKYAVWEGKGQILLFYKINIDTEMSLQHGFGMK